MKIRRGEVGLTLCLALVASCASMTFKRGASPDSAAADERACRAANASDADFAACMRERGYYVSGGKAPSSASQPQSAEPKVPTVAAVPSAPRAAASSMGAPVPTPGVVTGSAVAAPEAAAEPTGTDPLEKVNVASWWKLGASAGVLDRDIDRCVAQLGSAHRPEPDATVVTVGLRTCLRAAGWFAVGTTASQ